jgi:diaminopimelate decarboxylase
MHDMPARSDRPKPCPATDDYGQAVIDVFGEYHSLDNPDGPSIMFEPGRAITSSAQCLLVKILHVKSGKKDLINVIVDGGKNICIPLGYEHHTVFPASKMDLRGRNRYCNVYGPLCHPSDVLFKATELPDPEPGDILAIMDAGAYFVPNQMNFSNPRPSVVLVDEGKPALLRQRETFEDIVALDCPPNRR